MLKVSCALGACTAALLAFAWVPSASALTMKQCSEKYKAAQHAGTAVTMNWSEFRAAECGTGATMEIKKVKAPVKAKKEAKHSPAEKAKQATETAKVSEQDCSSRYQAAKAADTLGGMTWNEFRRAGCPATIAGRHGGMLPTAGSIYPATISRKYATLPEGRARELTCRDQYEANKAAGLSELKWTEQGGGYYSECNKRLSGH